MNQDNLINLIGDLAEQVRLLRMENTETQKAVKQLQREENNTPQTELPHVVPRAPVADLIFFPELSEANPLAEEDFFRNPIEEMSIKSFVEFKIDIAPIVSYFQRLGPTNLLSLKDLTEKTCWLLAVCGFMRASDMHRIDDVRTTLSDTSVCFVIVAPKEKRQGRPIERPCEIKAHNNKLMCPVDAYRIYKQKVANVPCTSPHVNDNDIIINHLFRYIKDNSKPISVDSISRNIKSIAKLIVTNGKQIPKARAIGATLAASAEYRQT
ncbi:hypothetical protein BB561_005264 [Smittium simulii]|uniref:Uncharacterized protein n=1 Tax=Smittium simulii TaxID=133385 RepID=A0A2T9YBB2_9FUNG|nr:hypothetical protein BB561_005264 [Smittium simulii]